MSLVPNRPYCLLPGVTLALVLSLVPYVSAQVSGSSLARNSDSSRNAAIGGEVVDETQAKLASVRIRLVAEVGDGSFETTTTANGSFTFGEVPTGSYSLSVEREGFVSREIERVRLAPGERATLSILLVRESNRGTSFGAPSQSPDPDGPESTLTWTREAAESLPLNGRSIQSLLVLAPGVSLTRSTTSDQGQFSANGQRANANSFVIDGVSANIGVAAGATGLGQSGSGSLPALSALGTTHALVTIDELAEARVQTSAVAPEFGRSTGSHVVLTTRSGSNELHGTLFGYQRIPALEARDWFAVRDRSRVGGLRHLDAGGVLGGPIVRERTFFFVSVEGLRLRVPRIASRSVPSLSSRDTAPSALAPYLAAFPLPTGPEAGGPLGLASSEVTDVAWFSSASARLDQQFGNSASLFVRYGRFPSESTQRGASGTSLNTTQFLEFDTETLTSGFTFELGRRAVNDVRVSIGRASAAKRFELDAFGGAVVLPATLLYPQGFGEATALLSLAVGPTSIAAGKDATNRQAQLNVVDTLAFSSGSHDVKLGIDFRRLTPSYGGWRYHQVVTFDPAAAASTGVASTALVQSQSDVSLSFVNWSAFAQDQWRVSPWLTLVYGLRWELNPAPRGRDDQDLYTVRGLSAPSTLALAPPGTPLFETSYWNFAPRFGVAYLLSRRDGWESTIRAAIGLYYDLGTGPVANAASSFPYQRRRFVENTLFPLDAVVSSPIAYSLEPPVAAIRAADPRLALPRTLEWHVGVEQRLTSRYTVSAALSGAEGTKLLRTRVLIDPNPDFARVYVLSNDASSRYTALKVLFRGDPWHGSHAFASYTLARSTDDVSSDAQLGPLVSSAVSGEDRGPSDFDARHLFTAGLTVDIPDWCGEGLGSTLFRDWSLDAIFTARSALPFDLFYFREPFAFRPDLRPGASVYVDDASVPGGRRIDAAAFAFPTAGGAGAFPRNALRGFAYAQADIALRRRVAVGESVSVTVGAEVFNALDRANFANPIGNLEDPRFGRSVSTLASGLSDGVGLTPAYQSGAPRTVQLALRFQF